MTTLARYDATPDDVPILHVLFVVGGTDYAIAADAVVQLESYAGCTKVPGTPSYVAGLVQIRGRVLPVVDLRIRFGLAVTPPTIDSRVVVAQHGDRVVGLLVDSAREVARIAPSKISEPPPIAAAESQGFITAVAQVGARMVMLVDFAKVIGEEHVDVVE